jgi:ribosomal subunit interface protein
MDNDIGIVIAIRSQHCDVPDALRTEMEHKIARLRKYFTGIERAEVCFRHETQHHRHGDDLEICEVAVYGRGHVVRASARGHDQKAAAERVVDKLEVNLTRLKTKLVGRSQPRRRSSVHSGAEPGEPAGGSVQRAQTEDG